jgi:Dockerin type I domain
MRKNTPSESGLFNPRFLAAFALCSAGMFLAMLSFATTVPVETMRAEAPLASASGSWSIVTSPNTSPAEGNALNGVTCVSASDCWAVGNHYNGSAYLTLTEHWDGTAWTIVASPNTEGTANNNLYGVACTSTSDCWAVGQALIGAAFRTLIERWDGTSWNIVPSPNGGTRQDILQGVTCVSASDCWAVGYYNSGTNAAGIFIYPSLIEHWDGAVWSITNSANTSATQNILWNMACASASNCWSVGYETANTPVGPFQTLIEQWDGNAWSIASSPNSLPAQNNYLFASTCASASNCRAAGYYNVPGAGVAQTLIEHWDGTAWTIESSPNVSSTQNNAFFGLTCPTASDCWAVGYNSASGAIQTLIERWDGSSWSITSSPNTAPSQQNVLNSVACSSAYDCWAVGYYNNDASTSQTLIEHYAVPPVRLVEAVSRKVHGSAGTFDVVLRGQDPPPPGYLGIECRGGGANGDYTLVFTFTNPLASVANASVISGTGSVVTKNIDRNDAHNYIVNLTGVTNAQVITMSLSNVADSAGNFSSAISVPMGVLIGDVNASGVVTSGDTNLCKAQALQPVTSANFRCDINASGSITTGDVNIIKQNALSHLPP